MSTGSSPAGSAVDVAIAEFDTTSASLLGVLLPSANQPPDALTTMAAVIPSTSGRELYSFELADSISSAS
jgi:hypothetical protein